MKPTSSISSQPESSLWNTADVAQFLGCSERQVYVLRTQGLPSIHIGGMVRFDPGHVRQWIERGGRTSSEDERTRQLADIASSGDDDNAQCAAADLAREFPSLP